MLRSYLSTEATMRRLARAYDRLNTSRPYLTKGITCGTLLGAGDLLCQGFTMHPAAASSEPSCSAARQSRSLPPGSWDGDRTARMFLWGTVCNGPFGHIWYRCLDRVVHSRGIGGARGIFVKVAADQLVFTPPLTFLYFIWQHVLSTKTLALVPASDFALAHLWPTLRVNFVYWSAVHIITFSFVPLSYRVAFVAVKNFFWGAWLSFATNDGQPSKHAPRLTSTATGNRRACEMG